MEVSPHEAIARFLYPSAGHALIRAQSNTVDGLNRHAGLDADNGNGLAVQLLRRINARRRARNQGRKRGSDLSLLHDGRELAPVTHHSANHGG